VSKPNKVRLEGRKPSGGNAAMPRRIPRSLTKKRNQLAYEREQMRARLAAVTTELAALDYALTVIAQLGHRIPLLARYESAQKSGVARSCFSEGN